MKKIKTSKNRKDLEWFSKKVSKTKLDKYSGDRIAIKDKKILSNGENIKTVIKKAEKLVKEPILVRIPKDKEILIL